MRSLAVADRDQDVASAEAEFFTGRLGEFEIMATGQEANQPSLYCPPGSNITTIPRDGGGFWWSEINLPNMLSQTICADDAVAETHSEPVGIAYFHESPRIFVQAPRDRFELTEVDGAPALIVAPSSDSGLYSLFVIKRRPSARSAGILVSALDHFSLDAATEGARTGLRTQGGPPTGRTLATISAQQDAIIAADNARPRFYGRHGDFIIVADEDEEDPARLFCGPGELTRDDFAASELNRPDAGGQILCPDGTVATSRSPLGRQSYFRGSPIISAEAPLDRLELVDVDGHPGLMISTPTGGGPRFFYVIKRRPSANIPGILISLIARRGREEAFDLARQLLMPQPVVGHPLPPALLSAGPPSPDWQSYENERFGYRIRYPQDWSVEIRDPQPGDDPSLPPYHRASFSNGTESVSLTTFFQGDFCLGIGARYRKVQVAVSGLPGEEGQCVSIQGESAKIMRHVLNAEGTLKFTIMASLPNDDDTERRIVDSFEFLP